MFTESGLQTVYAMYVGALLKYLFTYFRIIVEKCISSSHNTKPRRQQKALLHYTKTSKLTETLIQYKAVKVCYMVTEIGLWHIGTDKEQNISLHRFYRDILSLYLNDSNDILAFLSSKLFFFYSTINSSSVSTSNSSASNSFWVLEVQCYYFFKFRWLLLWHVCVVTVLAYSELKIVPFIHAHLKLTLRPSKV